MKKNKYVKTPTVYQMEATECGAASLSMIFSYYKKFLPLEKVRIDCGVSRDGCNAKNILLCARKYGVTAKGYRKGLNSLLECKNLPVIIHWNFNHFVVYEGYKNGYHYLNDPAVGRRKITQEDLDDGYTGIVLEFETNENFVPSKERRTLFSYVYDRIKNEKLSIVYLIIIGLFLIVPGIIIPVFSKVFIDDILIGGNTDWFRGLVWAMLAMGLLSSGLGYLQSSFLMKFQTKLSLLSTDLFLKRVFRLPIQFFEQRSAGDIESRIGNNDQVASFLAGELASTVIRLLTAVFYLIILLIYSPKLTAIGVVFAVFNIVFLKITNEKVSNQKMKMDIDDGKLQGTLFSGIRIINSLKASGAENSFIERLLGYYAKTNENEQNLGTFRQYMSAIPQLTKQFTDVVILIVGGIEVINGNMTVGMLLAFSALMSRFLSPVNALVGFAERIQDLKVSMERLNDVNNYQLDDKFLNLENKIDLDKTKLDGYIHVENLVFGYSLLEKPVIVDSSFSVLPGRSVAFVGPSGSGKSTVSKVISGMYRPWSGKILFDNVDSKNIKNELFTQSVAVVSQEISMFSGTVKENLTLWDDTVLDSDIINACKDALIHDVISSKSGGYNHIVIEGGSNFSGGQRQRLEIARALAKNPSILILDEATSALDANSEKVIMDNIKKRGCTVIIIAHRLSAIRDCDEIIVMNYGEIVQRGVHDELKLVEGHYRELIRNI